MVQIINPYKPDNTLGEALSGLGDAFFGPKATQADLYRQKALEQRRANEYTPLVADAISQPGHDIGLTARYGVMAGMDPKNLFGYRSGVRIGSRDPLAVATVPGQAAISQDMLTIPGTDYRSTPNYATQQLNIHKDTELGKTERIIAADQLKNAREIISVRDPLNPLGYKSITRAEFLANPGAYQEVTSQDILKSSIAGGPSGYMSGFPGQTPSQAAYVGSEQKGDKGINFRVQDATGNVLDEGVTFDSRTHVDGRPIKSAEGFSLQLISPLSSTAGQPTAGPLAKELRESRAATQIATAQIDRVITDLAKPTAASSLGVVGMGASVVNNIRAQVDAVTGAAREGGFAKVADLFDNGAKGFITQNPNLLVLAQQRGISYAQLQSQISSLGYAIARANNQQGTLGVRDVEDALREIGANLYDPVAFSAVLNNVKTRLIEGQEIRERVAGGTASPQARRALGLSGQGATPPATGGTTVAPGATGAVAAPPPPPGFVLD